MAALSDVLHNVQKRNSTNSTKQVKFAAMLSTTIDTISTNTNTLAHSSVAPTSLNTSSLQQSPRKNSTAKVKGTILVQDNMDPRKVKNVLVSMPSDASADHTYAKENPVTGDTSSSDDTSSSSDNESIDVKTTPIELPVLPQSAPKGRGRPRKSDVDARLPSTPQLKSILKPTASSEPKVTFEKVKRRGRGCGNCAGCLREDCGNCCYCLDKPKFGGPGKKKQRCALRVCANFVSHKSNTAAARNSVLQSKSLLSPVDTAKLLNDIPSYPSTTISSSSLSFSTLKSLSKPLLGSLTNNIPMASSPNSQGPSPATPTSRTNSKQVVGGGANDDIIKCINCSRERKLSMSRSNKFCSGKCLKDWELMNPGRNPDISESMEINLNFPMMLQSDKPVPRALKNLQIDMALPGERHHESKTSDLLEPIDTILATMDTSTLLTAGSKRSHSEEGATTLVKKSKAIMTSPISSPVVSTSPFVLLSNTVKQSAKKGKLNITEVSSWSISDVVRYFENMGECSHIAPVLYEQEVDGEALLLLSHDSLVKCLGMKLGPALKVMTHVDRLKLQASSSF